MIIEFPVSYSRDYLRMAVTDGKQSVFLNLTDEHKAVLGLRKRDEMRDTGDENEYQSLEDYYSTVVYSKQNVEYSDPFDGYETIDEDFTPEWRVLSRLDGEMGEDWRIVSPSSTPLPPLPSRPTSTSLPPLSPLPPLPTSTPLPPLPSFTSLYPLPPLPSSTPLPPLPSSTYLPPLSTSTPIPPPTSTPHTFSTQSPYYHSSARKSPLTSYIPQPRHPQCIPQTLHPSSLQQPPHLTTITPPPCPPSLPPQSHSSTKPPFHTSRILNRTPFTLCTSLAPYSSSIPTSSNSYISKAPPYSLSSETPSFIPSPSFNTFNIKAASSLEVLPTTPTSTPSCNPPTRRPLEVKYTCHIISENRKNTFMQRQNRFNSSGCTRRNTEISSDYPRGDWEMTAASRKEVGTNTENLVSEQCDYTEDLVSEQCDNTEDLVSEQCDNTEDIVSEQCDYTEDLVSEQCDKLNDGEGMVGESVAGMQQGAQKHVTFELERYQSPEEEEDDSTEDEEIPVSLLPFTRPPTRNTRSPFGVSRHATPHGSQRRRKHTTPSPLDSGYKTMEHSYDGDSSVSSDGQIREKQTDHWEQVDRSRENTGHDRSRENPGHRTQGIMHKETEMDRISRLAPGVSHQPRRGESVYPCYLLGLPDQQLLRLLSYLPTMALVRLSVTCRRIHKLAWNSQLWQTIRLVGEQVDVDRALRSMLVKLVWGVARQGGWDRSPLGAPGVECVQLGGSARLTDRALALLARNCPQLRQLELQHCRNVTNGGVLDLLSRCNRLEHLDLTGCVMVTSLNHGRRGQELLSLGYLDLSECGSLDDTGLQMVVTSCPNLTHLYLRKCTGISDRGVKSIASYCPQLRELSLSDCKGVGDQGVQELSRLGPSLRYLSVAKCPALTDFGLRPVWKHCYKLRYLNLRGCTAMNDSTLQYIASSCTKLRSLDVGKCEVSDQGLRLLASRLPNLRKLSVRGCSRVQDGGVAALAGGCTSLTHLNIEDCDLSVNLVRSLIKTLRRCYIQHSAALG